MNDRLPVAPQRRRHLMDPAAPQRDTINSAGITRVQTWVLSILAVSTILHLAIAVLLAAWLAGPDHLVSQLGLTVISGAFGVIAFAVGRLIHRAPVVSPVLLLGLLPIPVGLVWFLLL
ncbi:hypothetical protein [Nocardioides bruguierae]|uniref:hypothetical protein n=1 Tax=Nocardioides bruguierae TaxID=2945102 RepID=UPI0020205706|nr:hypothetical protein [Nocardioides bruguierae]MCL8025628.1 hypothetical protein [Nocardioides bruguierae]